MKKLLALALCALTLVLFSFYCSYFLPAALHKKRQRILLFFRTLETDRPDI